MDSSSPSWLIAILNVDPAARDLVRYSLTTSFPNCRILEPKHPGELLDATLLGGITAVVTAYNLIGMNGIELIGVLRQRGYAGPVLMLTNAEEKEQAARAAGADEFLPFVRWSEVPARIATMILSRFDDSPLPLRSNSASS
jgi:DNA-binding response OmpR family regulator